MSIRSLVCACIGAVVVLVLLALVPRHALNPKGIVLPATNKIFSAVSPDQVRIFKEMPEQEYQVVATIRAEQGYVSPSDQKSQEKLIEYVKKLAGSVGANGVIIRFLCQIKVFSRLLPL